MAVYTYEIATEFNFPNLTIERKLRDGVQIAWRLTANEGYVFYDTTANDIELDPETMEERPVIYYYRVRSLSLNRDFANFPFVAVSESNAIVQEWKESDVVLEKKQFEEDLAEINNAIEARKPVENVDIQETI